MFFHFITEKHFFHTKRCPKDEKKFQAKKIVFFLFQDGRRRPYWKTADKVVSGTFEVYIQVWHMKVGYFGVPDFISGVKFKIWVEFQDGRQRPFWITLKKKEEIDFDVA